MTPEDLKSALLGSAIDNELNTVMDRDATVTRRGSNLSDALAVAREQELHKVTLEQKNEEITNTKLKNEQAMFKIEYDKAKAQADGLSIATQDPKGPWNMVPPKFPSSGQITSELLQQQDPNIGKGVLNAVRERLNLLRSTGQRSTDLETTARDDWMQDQLIDTLKKVDEKHLAYTPLGKAGEMIGGVLDILTGPLDLGTELLGGRISAAQKAELFTRAINSNSPIMRAQMNDVLRRDLHEQTALAKLGNSGLFNTRYALKSDSDMEGADALIGIGIDIHQKLADAVPNSFGSDASTGLGDAYKAYENVHSLLYKLEQARTEEEAISISAQIAEADRTRREAISSFYARGGTPEQLRKEIVNSIDTINKEFQQPLNYTGDKFGTEFAAQKKVVAKTFTDRLNELDIIIQNDIPVNVKEARQMKFGPKVAEEYSRVEETQEYKDIKVGRGTILPEDYSLIMAGNPDVAQQKLKSLERKMSDADLLKIKERMLKMADGKKKTAVDRMFAQIAYDRKVRGAYLPGSRTK